MAACLVAKRGHSDGGQAYPLNARIADSILRGGPGLPRLGKANRGVSVV